MTRASDEWRVEDIALVFLTCPREPAYFAATLASALVGDPLAARLREIAVAVDAPDLECVASLAHHARVRWVPRTTEETARVQGFHVHRRACHNYWRALGLASPDARGTLVCEDDVIFRDGWLGMLLDALNEMQDAGIGDFLLAAYSAGDHEAPALRRGQYYSSYVAGSFYGTQAMFYPAGESAPVRELLWEHGVVVSEAPYDLLIQRRAVAQQHLYSTRHSLVQHTGARSTGLGDGRHRSPSFSRPWPAPSAPVLVPGEVAVQEGQPEFGVVMNIVERPDQVEWALQRLRAVHPAAPFVLISDGKHHERYARIAEHFGGAYQRGERLKIPARGLEWWQRTFEAGLALETPYVLKIDPDTSFNQPITRWPEFDCFGTVTCRGSDREHIQGGVQGFRREAIERIAASGICLRPEFREAESWAWDAATAASCKQSQYFSTDQALRRILMDLRITWGDWPEVKSWFDSTPPDASRFAISHPHKWVQLTEHQT